jgi:hypothetical protein
MKVDRDVGLLDGSCFRRLCPEPDRIAISQLARLGKKHDSERYCDGTGGEE